jgi:ribulose-phosphate 3-epimerase
MDGRFVPNITFGPPIVESLRRHTTLALDTHLMIVEPDRYLEDFRRAGADIITVHQEACTHLQRTVSRIRELGAKAGVAINPATPVAALRDVLDDIDLILVMSVNPGFGGQKFLPRTIDKLNEAKALIRTVKHSIHLEVDGGIDPTNARRVVKAGATVLVAGTSIFRQENIPEAIRRLRRAAAT